MLKIIIFCFIFILLNNVIYPQQILKEIYYDSNGTKISGVKEYIYDARKNIKKIKTYDTYHNLEIVFKYFYNIDKLISVDEYLPNSTTILKYSTFIYKNSLLIKKLDFDSSNNILLYHNFVYDKTGKIKGIIDTLPNGTYLGKREFIYRKDKLTTELLLDGKNNILVKKKYIYNSNLISSVEFYTKQGIKIRVIKRLYSKEKSTRLSVFGFNANFFDFR